MTAPAPGDGDLQLLPSRVADRAREIRGAGWGMTIRLFQPRNPAFWVYLIVVGLGVLIISRFVSRATVVYGTPLVLGVLGFAVYGVIFWAFTVHIDRYAHQPGRMIGLALLWGGFGAIAMASSANTPILSLWSKAMGADWASDWGAGLTAPFVEETAKGVGLLLLIAFARRAVATAFDGFILGAFIGLGFQIVEDVTYAVGAAGAGFGADPTSNILQTLVLRTALGFGAHIAYSAIFCTGLAYLIGRPAQPPRRAAGLGLMITAMALHGLWDNVGGIVGAATIGLFAMWIGLTAVTLTVVVLVFRIVVIPERAIMRSVLEPEVVAGTITADEAAALAGDRKARRAYRRATGDRRRRRQLLWAGRDLANELATAGGAETERVAFARQEITRLRGAGAQPDTTSGPASN